MSTQIIEWEQGTGSLGRAVAAIGVFDGVHIGHRTLIADTTRLAHETGSRAIAVTFDRDPEQVVSPDRHVPQLLRLEDKLELIAAENVDAILVIPFCVRLANMPPDFFLDEVLLRALKPVAVAVGHDFRFGARASGNVAVLERFGTSHGFEVRPHELVEVDGAPVTATRIRSLIAQGDVERAARLLGRPHRVPGTVVHGRGAGGSELGIPTANLAPWTHAALPADGVYSGTATVDGQRYAAAISVGKPPMFPDSIDHLEAHLIDFAGDLYGREVVVEFHERLRGLLVYRDNEELARSIRADIACTRATFMRLER